MAQHNVHQLNKQCVSGSPVAWNLFALIIKSAVYYNLLLQKNFNILKFAILLFTKKTQNLYSLIENNKKSLKRRLFSSVGLERPSHTRKVTSSSLVTGKDRSLFLAYKKKRPSLYKRVKHGKSRKNDI